jgi:hypothetical protein
VTTILDLAHRTWVGGVVWESLMWTGYVTDMREQEKDTAV